MLSRFIFTSVLCVLLIACGSESSSSTPKKEKVKQSLLLTYDFSESAQGFSIDTADHYVEHRLNDEITSEIADLPSPYEYRKGVMFQWNNYSDDIKGFIKKKITGLNANSQFRINFNVDVLTFMSDACSGIGGSPGKSVKVKAALLVEEPVKSIESYNINNILHPYYVISIDDGQSGGDDVVVLGHIGLPIPCDDIFFANPVWEIKPLSYDEDFLMTTNSNGEGWIYVSIDSGFEGRSTFYLTEVELSIQEL